MTSRGRTTAERTSWLPHAGRRPPGEIALVCLPYAGAGAVAFRDWHAEAPRSIEVLPMEYPGRGMRLREAPIASVTRLTLAAAEPLASFCRRPYALFGHSLGAFVAYELARALTARGLAPRHLFVSGSRAPHLPPLEPPTHALPLRALCDRLRRWGGVPEQVLADPGLLAMLEPALRADLAAAEGYARHRGDPLDLPITAFAGSSDPLAPPAAVEGWSAHTSRRLAVHVLPGGHFFLHANRPILLGVIGRELACAAAPERSVCSVEPA